MSSYDRKQRAAATAKADERLLAELGYKQEFRREFTPSEVRWCRRCLSRFTSSLVKLPQIEDIRGCVQRRWTLAVYSVSNVPSSVLSSATPSTVVHSSVLFYSIPNGGPVAMVWGVGPRPLLFGPEPLLRGRPQWAVASFFIVVVGMSMAELTSAAPTSGGVSTLPALRCICSLT
jgi:hypothetical protein